MQPTKSYDYDISSSTSTYMEEAIISSCNSSTTALLPPDYVPGNWDVICQRGKDCHDHVGNRRFRICVENHVESYVNAKTRQDKSNVISAVVRSIKESASHEAGGFIMKDAKTNQWFHVDNKVARDKVGNALRDVMKQRSESPSRLSLSTSTREEAPVSSTFTSPIIPSVPRQENATSCMNFFNNASYGTHSVIPNSTTGFHSLSNEFQPTPVAIDSSFIASTSPPDCPSTISNGDSLRMLLGLGTSAPFPVGAQQAAQPSNEDLMKLLEPNPIDSFQ